MGKDEWFFQHGRLAGRVITKNQTLRNTQFFLPNSESGKLQIFTRSNQILPDQKYDNVTQQYVINFIFQDTF